jgi:hypothetical protein
LEALKPFVARQRRMIKVLIENGGSHKHFKYGKISNKPAQVKGCTRMKPPSVPTLLMAATDRFYHPGFLYIAKRKPPAERI